MAEAGQRIGDYEILAQLGAGGMGRVYKVRNVISNREEAMKILLPDFAADEELAARFMAEIRTLATLEHPGIAQLRTAFQFQNQLVMIMEYVEGITLEKLASQIRIPQDHALDFASQVLAALSYAHSQGVTHRDIKPANIMVTTHGLVKLMDFGIAKSGEDMRLTRPGTTMGSVYYMSPEQVRGGTADARTDLYSLGVTMYEILTGRKPFQADTSYSVLDAQLNQAPTPLIEVNPAIPPALNAIVLKAMEKLPEDRFQTADEFRAALKGLRESAAAISQAAAASQAAVPVAQAAVPVAQPAMANAMPQAGPSAISNAGPVSPPPFTPVPQVAMPARVGSRSHRGLWIGLGAGLALLALVAVATVLPHFLASRASPKQAASEMQAPAAAPAGTPAGDTGAATVSQPASSQPASGAAAGGGQADAAPASSGPANAGQAGTAQAASGPTASGQAGSAHARPAYTGAANAAGGHAAGSAQSGASAGAAASSSTATSAAQGVGGGAAAAGASPAELQAAQDRMGELHARADAATAQIQQLRSQQQAMGMDLRGDILGAMNRLQFNMSQANRALNQNDVASANDYMKKAENSIEVLEKFLGR